LPHSVCGCPRGEAPPLAGKSPALPVSSCCCCGGKCGTTQHARGQGARTCCGRPAGKPRGKLPDPGFGSQPPGCVHVVAQPEILSVLAAKAKLPDPLKAGPALPLVALPCAEPRTVPGRVEWAFPLLPPPTDLVISLQHFLI